MVGYEQLLAFAVVLLLAASLGSAHAGSPPDQFPGGRSGGGGRLVQTAGTDSNSSDRSEFPGRRIGGGGR